MAPKKDDTELKAKPDAQQQVQKGTRLDESKVHANDSGKGAKTPAPKTKPKAK